MSKFEFILFNETSFYYLKFVFSFLFFLLLFFLRYDMYMLTAEGSDKSKMHGRKENKNTVIVFLTIWPREWLGEQKCFSSTAMLTSKSRSSAIALKTAKLTQWGSLAWGRGNIFRVVSKGNGVKLGHARGFLLKGYLFCSLTMLSVGGLDRGRPHWIQVKEIQLEKKGRQTPNQRRGYFSWECYLGCVWREKKE